MNLAKNKTEMARQRLMFQLFTDARINRDHIILVAACIYLQHIKSTPYFSTSRRELMRLAHIRSPATYHRCIRQLVKFGYITYHPSYHPVNGSQVAVIFPASAQ